MKTNTQKTIGYYLRASSKHKPSGFVMVVAMFVATILEMVKPLYYKKFFDLLVVPGEQSEIFHSLINVLIIVAAIQFGIWFLRRVNNFVANYFESKVIAELNNFCFAHLHRHSFSYFNNNFVGSLTKKVKWFVGAFESITDRIVWHIMPLIVSIVFITVVLFDLNFWLGLTVLVWLLVFWVINWLFIKFKLKYDIERTEKETTSTAILADTITNNANVKLFNGYKREILNYTDANEQLRKIRRWTWDLGSIFDSVQAFLAAALELGIMFYAVFLWRQGDFSFGSFVLVQSYLGTIIGRIWDFGNIIRRTYQDLADAEEMTIVLSTEPEIQDILNAKKLTVSQGEIEFNNVDFYYHQTRKIFSDFNLKVLPGEKVAFVGPSGAGKSTVVKLLLRMFDLSGGHILIDGQDIARVTQESLWESISLVPQDPVLFHRTLKENIRYGKPTATDEEIIEASKKAHCHEFISQLENGYDTYVGERGVKLSGGERQRVAIARAILRNAPILVLDEATSSLDSESEYLIQDALLELMKGKTVLVIAHRLSTIKNADRIIVVQDGQIIEEGDHEKLATKKDGVYKKLWQFQAGGFVQ